MGASLLRDRQNDAGLVQLLRAVAVSHRRAQRMEALCLGISGGLAAASLVAAFVNTTAAWISTLGGMWAVAYAAGICSWAEEERRRGAVLQEMFDTQLYRLRWNRVSAGEALPSHEVSRLSRRFRGSEDSLRDHYTFAAEAPPPPYDVLACQHQNLAWGARIRERWAMMLLFTVGLWSLLGLLVGYAASLTLPELLVRWYLPSLTIILVALDGWRAQRWVVAQRRRLLQLVREALDCRNRDPVEVVEFARSVQDAIFHTREEVSRVPEWFYTRFRPGDEEDFAWDETVDEPAPVPSTRHADPERLRPPRPHQPETDPSRLRENAS